MTLYELMGLISTVALLLPILLLFIFKLSLYRSFPALLAYFTILFFCNLCLLEFIAARPVVISIQEAIHNILEAPLTLIFMTYFSRTVEFRRKMMWAVAALLVYELVILILEGFTENGYRLLTAPGLVLALGFGLYFFVYQVKLSIIYQKATGKALLISAMLFSTIGFSYIYIVRHYTSPGNRLDADLIQFMISLFVGLGVTIGLLFERKRVKQLEELRIAREELKEIYGDEAEKTTGPFGAAAFHLDNDNY